MKRYLSKSAIRRLDEAADERRGFCRAVSEHLNECGFEDAIVKFLGDGLFAFFPLKLGVNESILDDDEVGVFLIKEVDGFRAYIHDDLPSKLNRLRLKSIIGKATDVRITTSAADTVSNRDVLGRNIDFLFRLEKFGGSTHIISNFSIERNSFREKMLFSEIKCQRKFKGWGDESQTFYILTSKELIVGEAAEGAVSADHVFGELLKFICDAKQSEEAVEDSAEQKSNWRMGLTSVNDPEELDHE